MEESKEEVIVIEGDLMSDEEDDSQSDSLPWRKKQFDLNIRNKLDIKKIISEFIIKKEYFITHKKHNILDDYDLGETPLGEGAFGKVYKAIEKRTKLVRAAKKIDIYNLTNKDTFLKEVSALKVLDHPNIIKLYEVYEDVANACVYLIEEFCEGGELFDYIVVNEGLPEPEAKRVFHQIVSSLLYCHKNCISHRDLKPDNFMLASSDPGATIKLIDFGLSRQFFKFHEGGGEVMRMETKAGTKLYMAPEVLDGTTQARVTCGHEVSSLYIMVSFAIPFERPTEMESDIRNLNYNFDNPVWKNISSECKDLISKLLVPEKDRITAKRALKHPWMKNSLVMDEETRNKTILMERFENFKDSGMFKKAVLSFLASKVNDDDIKEEIALFRKFDDNNDGYITRKELAKGLRKLKYRTDEEIDEIMERMDTDKNGAINFNEFISASLNDTVSKDFQRIEEAFHFFDKDGDGYIDEHELQTALAQKDFPDLGGDIFIDAIKE
eukprot:CAMPEP_0197002958 /NCGR_PEP_ID=MMETSP1380-20130617/7346_1 /TAXON_ID=5936 /ORGANISM="Euplotes crassus, Strain CT5" /LENGTH=495 /DNA_ID=CAMNT_0042421309 /DNA_START=8 /DNA_END=1496 /DNA_ORIENTATION=-